MYASSAVNGDQNELRLFTGRAHPGLGKEIADILGVALGKIQISTFPDTETWVQVDESVRESDVFILQPTGPPVNDNLMELLVMLDAFKKASAASITTVIPYFGYAKQDRKSTGREPISARLAADILICAGADRVVSIDLHVPQIQGFFSIPMDHLTALTTLVKYLRGKDLSNAVVVAPDAGRADVAEKYAGLLDLPMALMNKRRRGPGGTAPEVVALVGDVRGKTPIIIDDMISTGGTISSSAKALTAEGANPCYIAATHGVLVGNALQTLNHESIREVVVTNSVPISDEKRALQPKLSVLTIAPLLAEVIRRIYNGESVSHVFRQAELEFPV